nr:hypothetical protein KPHV_87510 [Kitasatospora purpeofusca]
MATPARSWLTVEMPPAIAALRRDSRGYPVPWATLWDNGHDTKIAWPASGGPGVVGCSCWPGRGRPVLGQLCPVRQRACMTRRRCQLCGHAIATDEPAVFVSGRPNGRTQHVAEPPLHPRCAAYALRVCPHLITGHRAGQVHVAETGEYLLLEEHVSPGADSALVTHVRLPGELPAPSAAPSVLHHYLAVPAPPWTPADDWLAARS